MTITELKRVATYERVSSDVQRDRETIRTQSGSSFEQRPHGADRGYLR